MSKIRLYLQKEQISENVNIVDRDVIHKLRDVLTVGRNERIYVFDGQGSEYSFRVEKLQKNSLLIRKEQSSRSEKETRKKIILGIPILKEQKIELIIEKATELGIYKFQPFICERSIRRPFSLQKIERFKKIIQEASRQSDRLWLPQIEETLAFEEIITRTYALKLCCFRNGERLTNISQYADKEIFIIAGPEGDFSDNEYSRLKANNFKFIKIAGHILRSETACLFCSGLVNYLLQ
jgi:16S rRNA (uracil1498-N3)-methyltransferase